MNENNTISYRKALRVILKHYKIRVPKRIAVSRLGGYDSGRGKLYQLWSYANDMSLHLCDLTAQDPEGAIIFYYEKLLSCNYIKDLPLDDNFEEKYNLKVFIKPR